MSSYPNSPIRWMDVNGDRDNIHTQFLRNLHRRYIYQRDKAH